MQQAYRVLRIVAEAQTIRMVLMLTPNEIILSELYTACTALNSESSRGVKAVVLDFQPGAGSASQGNEPIDTAVLQEALEAVRAVAAPVLAVVRGNLSEMAGILVQAADLTLVAHDVVLPVQIMASADGHDEQDGQYQSIHETLTGEQASRLGLVNWSVPVQQIGRAHV